MDDPWSSPNRFLATEGPPAGVAGPEACAREPEDGPVGNLGLPLYGLQAPPLFMGLIPKVMAGEMEEYLVSESTIPGPIK